MKCCCSRWPAAAGLPAAALAAAADAAGEGREDVTEAAKEAKSPGKVMSNTEVERALKKVVGKKVLGDPRVCAGAGAAWTAPGADESAAEKEGVGLALLLLAEALRAAMRALVLVKKGLAFTGLVNDDGGGGDDGAGVVPVTVICTRQGDAHIHDSRSEGFVTCLDQPHDTFSMLNRSSARNHERTGELCVWNINGITSHTCFAPNPAFLMLVFTVSR